MALIKDRKDFVRGVSVIVEIDMGIQALAFPSVKLHKTKTIEYDVAVIEGTTVAYNSFAKTSNTTIKDGKSIVTISAVNLNDSISKDAIEADAIKFGQNEYGEGEIDAETESALNGVGRLRLNHLATSKAIIYESITTHQIKDGYETVNGLQDIVFAVPSSNKIVFDGSTEGQKYWSSSTDSKPFDNIVAGYNQMRVKPSFAIMNDVTFGRMVASAQIVGTQFNQSKPQNWYLNTDINPTAQFYRGGRMVHNGVVLDIYVERQRKADGNPYMPTEYVVLSSPIGEMNFGGIPIVDNGGIRNIVAEWDVQEVITFNPPLHELVVRTAPLPTLKNGEGYYSMRIES
ncbi:MAG: hypothetical protein JJW00_00235 [Sulfurimonas sp.]|nr:hypothetical protein [Sulfurimonas sp.]